MKDSSTFLAMRRYKNWAHKILSWKHLTIWRPVLPVFPRAQSTSFLISTLNSFQGCWRPAAATAHDLILVEVDVCACMLSLVSHVQLFVTQWTAAYHVHLFMGFSRQEYWSGLPCPLPGDLPDPGIEPASLMSPALTGEFFTTSTTWETQR